MKLKFRGPDTQCPTAKKILDICLLMVAMIVVAAYAVGDNQVTANPVNQRVAVTVPEAIAIIRC